jgi:hypothetical protein
MGGGSRLLTPSAGSLGFDTIISECTVSNPAAPASQSLMRIKADRARNAAISWRFGHKARSLPANLRRPSKPLGTAAFRGYALVSVSGFGLQKRRSGPWSLRPTFWCLVFAERITFDDGGQRPWWPDWSGRISQADRRAGLPPRRGGRSLTASDRGSAVWQRRLGGVITFAIA